MRDLFLFWGFVAITMAAPASAQTYDPSYPVCLQIFAALDGGNYIECRFTSMAQCQASASGRGGMCMVNPYPAKSLEERGSRKIDPRSISLGRR